MLTQLDCEPLASRLCTARLLMFYKIHYGMVTTPMPLDIVATSSYPRELTTQWLAT